MNLAVYPETCVSFRPTGRTVECHGLSVTRSKAAAGRRNKAAYLPRLQGMTDGWENRLRDALPSVAGQARSLRKAHVNPYYKDLMKVCGI